jgi:DNA-binding GntR family transcriptional regulator
MAIVVRTLSDQAYELVRNRILSGEFGPGAPIRQDVISDELGVSKIPIREALTRLEQDGLLSSYPNRGYVVRALTAEEANEVFALRLKLEPEAVAEAALRASDAQREEARAALSALESELRRVSAGDDVALNRRFHMALVRPGGGLVTSHLIERLHLLAERYVRLHLPGREDRANSQHRQILEAWLQRDGSEVKALSRKHIKQTARDLQRQLARTAG